MLSDIRGDDLVDGGGILSLGGIGDTCHLCKGDYHREVARKLKDLRNEFGRNNREKGS